MTFGFSKKSQDSQAVYDELPVTRRLGFEVLLEDTLFWGKILAVCMAERCFSVDF
jgi:hypothetical protein